MKKLGQLVLATALLTTASATSAQDGRIAKTYHPPLVKANYMFTSDPSEVKSEGNTWKGEHRNVIESDRDHRNRNASRRR